jgi:hypothetical protein
MSEDVLRALMAKLDEDLDGLRFVDDALEAIVDCRYGELTVHIDYEPEVDSIRVAARVAAPAGAGPSFLYWCLAQNTQYWDVKFGIDEEGFLVAHADVDADPDVVRLSTLVADRVESIVDLVDRDLVDWQLANDLATPAQRARWTERPPTGSAEEDDETQG